MNPKVSIIILNWNGYQDTIECLKSVENISYDNYEIIIIDNFSSDNSEQYIKQAFPNYPIIQSGENLGFAGGNNLGIKYALENDTDYILLLNNDTIVEPDFLEPLIKSAEENDKIGIVGGKILYYNDPEKIWYAGGKINWLRGSGFAYGVNQKDLGQFDKEKPVTFITGCLMLIKKDVIKKIGLLRTDFFLYLEDTEYCSRAIADNYLLFYNPQSIIFHKRNADKRRTAVTIYYSTRNRLIFMRDYGSILNKPLFFTYITFVLTLKLIYWTVTGEKEFVTAGVSAIKDFYKK